MNVFYPRSDRREESKKVSIRTKGVFPSYNFSSSSLWVEPNGHMDGIDTDWWFTYEEKK